MTAELAAASGSVALPVGAQLGEYVLGEPLWKVRIADVYRANGPAGAAIVYVIHAPIAQNTAVRDHIIAGTRAAAALGEHKHLVHTRAAGLTGSVLWIATEDIDGSSVRDMLLKKRQQGASGFGISGTRNLIAGVCAALSAGQHGALSSESVVVNRAGRVRVVDLALGAGTAAAIAAGLIPSSPAIAPEVAAGQPPSGASEVFGIGALLYEALVGVPFERGGPRPSTAVANLDPQVDELFVRACDRDPNRRFGRAEVLAELIADAFGKGLDGPPRQATAMPGSSAAISMTSLAQELAQTAASGSGNAVVDRALAAALADSTEKFLVTKGKLDYGPFSLADIVTQIEKGDIIAGNVIMDKDTGARGDVAAHPLLGPIIETARQRRDDNRRMQAEVVHQSQEKKRGAMLYGVIGAGVIGVGVAVWLIVKSVSGAEATQAAGINKLGGASLKVTMSEPKAPPKRPGGGHHSGGARPAGGNGPNGNENLALDMSGDDDDDSTETLSMQAVYGVYSKYGGQLGGCLQSSGESSVDINMNIDGPSGQVTFVKVNGKQSGGAYGCLNRLLRSMHFPSIHGPRTRAEFSISL
jgi:hypothetical protein